MIEEIKHREEDGIKILTPVLEVKDKTGIEKILEDALIIKIEQDVGVSLTSLTSLRIG